MPWMLRLAFIYKVIRRVVAAFITTLPIITGLIAIWVCFNHFWEIKFIIPRYEPLLDGEVKESHGLAIEMINEINKFLISANSALFGLSGFFLNNYKHKVALFRNGLAYLLALLLLGCGYFFAFKVYTELLSNLSQGALAIDPDYSRISFYLRMEFKVCCSSSLILLSIFVSVFFYEKKEGADETSQKEPLPGKEAYNPSVV
jgi:hypothetical protein